MRIALLSCLGLVWLVSPGTAEDFTGFYAGVNAGYALQTGNRSAARGGAPNAPGGSESSATVISLPPSAQTASRTMQLRNRALSASTAIAR